MKGITFKEVGNNIQRLLNKKAMTQQSLADSLNISRQVMNKIINGAKAINVDEISRIAEVLTTSVDNLLLPAVKVADVQEFNFMGKISSVRTKEKISLMNDVIKEILLLENIADV